MKYQKIKNLLHTTPDNVPRFITKKCIEAHDQFGNAENRYKSSKEIRFKISMLQSDLRDYIDAYIVVKETINVTDPNNDACDKKLAFINIAPFIKYISKINDTLIDYAEYLEIVMSMYNLIEYSKNYSKTTGSLWNYYRDEPNSGAVGDMNHSIRGSKSFVYKTSITGRLKGSNTEKEVEIAVLLKHLSKFWRTLDIPLINCEINLSLICSENCVLTSKAARDADTDAPAVAEINNSAIKWNKYRSEMSKQTKTNNLVDLIDPAFNKGNRLFVLSLENEDGRTSFSKYYTSSADIKDFNVLIDGKSFFWCSNKKQWRNEQK